MKTIGRLYMKYFSKIIVGIYAYLQDHDDKKIKNLFSNAVDVFNALGSWRYGGTSPKIVYPDLQLFVKKANSNIAEKFSHLLDYINWTGNNLYKILEENQWIEEHYYESFTLKQTNYITTGLFFMWRLGWLNVRISDVLNENHVPILPHLPKAFDNLFDAFGEWIYCQQGIITVTQSFQKLENLLEEKYDPLYDEILEEANNTRNNIAKFLEKL